MVNSEELFDDLCADMPCAADEAGADAGVLTSLIGPALLLWLKKALATHGCPNRDAVVSVAQKFIADRVRNPLVAAVLNAGVSALADALCPVGAAE